jgi:hypothetical protein
MNFQTTSSRVTLRHVTITNNSTGVDSIANTQRGAGAFVYQTKVTLQNSIISGNSRVGGAADNCNFSGLAPIGHTLGPVLNNNIIGAGSQISQGAAPHCKADSVPVRDPQLHGPFGSFFIPRVGSPAIDAVACGTTDAGATIDQRGRTRPVGSQCDIGAIEDAGYVLPRSDDGGDGGAPASGGGGGDSSGSQTAPPVSTCLTLDGVSAYNLNPATQCQRVNAMQIANPDIQAGDFVDAVDVWGWVTPETQICFAAAGGGSFKFIDTVAMPRTVQDLPACSLNGMSCASINGQGMLVLLPGDAPPACAEAPQAPAPSAPARNLSDCMVKTTAVLRFRESPGGGLIIRDWIPDSLLPKDATLTAVERTDAWFKVDFYGVKGWISADWVEPAGGGACD